MLFRQLALAAVALASPLEKRVLNDNDYTTLNTLLYLENLQFALYNIGCNNYSDSDYTTAGYPVGFRQNICYAGQQGSAHVATLTAGLTGNGAAYVRACTYRFPTVTSPDSFVDLMLLINTVIEGAYLGAAEYLADVPGTDEVAQSIGAVKARQGGFLRSFSGEVPFPATFDTGISRSYAVNIIQQFVTSCPNANIISLSNFPNLNITGLAGSQLAAVGNVGGQTITLNYATNILAPFTSVLTAFGLSFSLSSPLYVAFISQNIFAPTYLPCTKVTSTSCTVVFPQGAQGVVYVVLTPYSGSGSRALSMDDLTSYGTAAGPVGLLVS